MSSHQALIHNITKIVCHYLHIKHSQDIPTFSENRWLTYCPVHEPDGWKDQDNKPNLHVYIGRHKQTGQEEIHWDCKSRGCDKQAIKAEFIKANLWPKESKEVVKRNLEVLPFEDEPDWSTLEFNGWPITNQWAFLNEQGKIAFWHVRADNPAKVKSDKGNRKKQYSRYFYVQDKDTGKKFNTFKATLKEKPIPYNAYFLQQRLEAPVLIVEGPKTADAASQLYSDYIVLTWDQGAQNYSKFNWELLRGRTTPIVLFPDNDDDGIKAMKDLGKLLMSMDLKPRIAFQEKLIAYPPGWDLADPIPEHVSGPDAILDDTEELEYSEEELLELKNNVVLSQKLEEYDRRFMPVLGGGDFYYYDVENPTISSSAGCPFPLYKERALYTAAPDKYYNEESGEQEYVMDVWKELPRKKLYNGLTYNPSTSDLSIQEGTNSYYLNMFIGFQTKPIESKTEENQWFAQHIYNLQGREAGEYTLNYLADIIQNPGRKPGTMMLWVGTQGNGKSLIGKIMVRLLGHLNAVVMSADVLSDQFTTEYASKLFVMPEEVPVHHRTREAIEQKLKYLITAENVRLNTKNAPAYQIPSFHRIILTANSIHGMKLDEDERRITIIECKSDFLKKQNSMIADRAYFDPLFAKVDDPQAMGKLLYFLSKYTLSIDITKPFITKAKQEQQRPKDPTQAVFEEILDTGVLPDYLLMHSRGWPVERVELPRNLMKQRVIEYCKENRITCPSDRNMSTTFFKLMPFIVRNDRFDKVFVIKLPNGTIEEKRYYIYELREINEHRKLYEEVTGRYPDWIPVNSHEVAMQNIKEQLDKESNVVPLKPKTKDETIL